MRKLWDEFKAFALRGSVLDLAIAVVIGAAFGRIITSLVSDIIMPVLNLLRPGNFGDLFIVLREGAAPGPYPSLAAATEAGAVTMNIGNFIDAIIMFLLIALALFALIRAVNALRREQPAAATTKDCPYCGTAIPLAAVRCPHCTSHLESTGVAA